MSFEHRSFNSQQFRPRPEVSYSEAQKLLLVATPWGPRSSAQRVIQTIQEYYFATRDDLEMTSPFQRLSCLSRAANNLRIATLLANEWLYREENKNEYVSGVEIFAAAIVESEVVWLHAGAPQVFLQRQGRSLTPLASTLDLSFDLSAHSELLSPLPSQLLGLDPTLNLTINSFRPRTGDQVILVSRSSLPTGFFEMATERQKLDSLTQLLAKDSGESPFWLGLWNID